MIGIIIQARTGSTRFPGKIYADISGKNTLYRVLEGVKKAQMPHKIILAMPEYDKSEFEGRFCNREFFGAIDERFTTYFGDPDNLVERYFQAARKEGLTEVVRVTADCPFIRGDIIDEMLCKYFRCNYNGFMGNNELVSSAPYPDGCDAEIFSYWMLAETRSLTDDPYHLEHVTPFMYRRGTTYPIIPFYNCRPNTEISTKIPDFSFDTQKDYEVIKVMAKYYDKTGDLNYAINKTYNDLNGKV